MLPSNKDIQQLYIKHLLPFLLFDVWDGFSLLADLDCLDGTFVGFLVGGVRDSVDWGGGLRPSRNASLAIAAATKYN